MSVDPAAAPSMSQATADDSGVSSPTLITTVVLFKMPAENVDEFIALWHDIQAFVSQQPGMIDGVGHRAVDLDGPYQFVNVVRWANAETLDAALKAVLVDFHDKGTDITDTFGRLGVEQTQSNFTEELRY